MTEMLKKEFSRKTFVKGGGAIVVGFSIASAGLAGRATAANGRGAAPGPFPQNRIDTWIAIHPDNTATVYTGRIELGQGTGTAWRQLTAEELDMSFEQVRFVQPDTNLTPDSGGTTGSTSIEVNGPLVRNAAAHARQALLGLAATSLGVPVASLSIDKGVVSGGGRSVKYGDLLGDKFFNVTMPTASLSPGQGISKPVAQYKIVGTRVPRFDVPDKITGVYTYLQNIRVPGMLHARVVRPRGQSAYGNGAKPLVVDETSIKSIAGARVMRQGDFVGVIAPTEYDAIQAAAQLKVTWQTTATLPGSGNMFGAMRAMKTVDVVRTQRGDVATGFAKPATVLTASYRAPYQSHGSMGPSCALAIIGPNGGDLFCNTNNPYRMRGKVGAMLGMDQTKIRMRYYEGASNYGRSPMEDAALAASLMSFLSGGKPVRVQFMRSDEHGWDNYGPAQMMDIRASVDTAGKIVAFDFHHWSTAGTPATDTSDELARGFALTAPTTQTTGNMSAGEVYGTPNYRFVDHTFSGLNTGSLRGGTLRSPMDPSQLFGSEQMVDALAYAAKMDPLAFRVANMGPDTRWIGALETAAQAANWKPRVAASNLSDANVVSGRGIALGTHKSSWAATVAAIDVNKKTGKITVKHMYAAMDSGLAINPGLIENQIVGQQIQGVSRALLEEVNFSKSNVTSLDWVTYPMLRFNDHPGVTSVVINRPDKIPTGAGEETLAPVPAAIANAFFDATGVRLYQYPMTPARVRAALAAASK